MNLVIDCFKLVKGVGKSIGIYNLTKSLVEYLGQENVRKGNPQTIIVLGNEHNRTDMEVPGVTFMLMKGNPLSRVYDAWWELFGVCGVARKVGADRILFPRGFRPLFYRGKDTIIIHDLIPFYYDKHYPGFFNKYENAYIMNRLKASMRHADRIITISEASEQDIVDLVPGAKGRIKRIYNGLNDIAVSDTVNKELMPEKPYFTAVTSKLPHKNAAGIMRAYEQYYKKAKNPLEMVVIGAADTKDFVEAGDLSKEAAQHVICHAYIGAYADMCSIIRGGVFFLFMSYAEGFGFPPLEAMQLDCPVISSDRTSLPEVVNDAGILVDPDDLDKVSDAMCTLQDDEALRKRLVEKGRENIRQFSWDSRTPLYWDELFQ